ncbi:hydrogenase iron-sulfur subunit [Candidatus Hydrogenedentota bacterium]
MAGQYLKSNVAVFFCRQLDAEQDVNRRALEREYGSGIKLFPLPCSGRIDPLHLMMAVESGANNVYLITCPEGACRYHEGNLRARTRLAYVQTLIDEIGLKSVSLELVVTEPSGPRRIDERIRELLNAEADK